ncbi:hypothetical protein N7523_004425 [Penicillium sp. IBT 18751x]|nr:hypothetical protein N7523_004425 [Penicillium sp. IBT 18751x]
MVVAIVKVSVTEIPPVVTVAVEISVMVDPGKEAEIVDSLIIEDVLVDVVVVEEDELDADSLNMVVVEAVVADVVKVGEFNSVRLDAVMFEMRVISVVEVVSLEVAEVIGEAEVSVLEIVAVVVNPVIIVLNVIEVGVAVPGLDVLVVVLVEAV